ncbi:MAG TPA: TlpA disulfide reductase family protein [Nocardioidaceae bacterium]|nr:TlpA disulfide reductase family protein [Nocardioidaceae bacterium]
MPIRSKYALVGVLVVLLAGAFVWRYGDSTGPVDTSSKKGQEILRGWNDVDDRSLPAISQDLPGIRDAADGIPLEGTYLVNVWASTCGPCKHEMPWLQRLSAEGEVAVLGVTRDNILSEALKFMDRRQITYPNVRDEFGDFMVEIGDVVPPGWLPSTFLVVDGKITWVRPGPFDSYEDLRSSVADRL